jgi:adenine-specific DNA methylase
MQVLYASFRMRLEVGKEEDFYGKIGTNARNYYTKPKVWSIARSLLSPEATLDYPFRFGIDLGEKALKWGKTWEKRIAERLEPFYPREKLALVRAYIHARVIPCPDTGYSTPLVPDWHLLKPRGGLRIVAEPVVDKQKGTWATRIREIGRQAGQLREPPQPTHTHQFKGNL